MDTKLFNAYELLNDGFLLRVKAFLFKSTPLASMAWWSFDGVTGWRGPDGVWVFFSHIFLVLAWICHIQAECLYRCFKGIITGGPLDSMSLDVTFLVPAPLQHFGAK